MKKYLFVILLTVGALAGCGNKGLEFAQKGKKLSDCLMQESKKCDYRLSDDTLMDAKVDTFLSTNDSIRVSAPLETSSECKAFAALPSPTGKDKALINGSVVRFVGNNTLLRPEEACSGDGPYKAELVFARPDGAPPLTKMATMAESDQGEIVLQSMVPTVFKGINIVEKSTNKFTFTGELFDAHLCLGTLERQPAGSSRIWLVTKLDCNQMVARK